MGPRRGRVRGGPPDRQGPIETAWPGPLEIKRIDLARIDELDQVDRVLRLEPQRLQLVRLDDHIVVGLDFVALDDVLVLDGALVRHDLLVADALAALAVELMELHACIAGRRRM